MVRLYEENEIHVCQSCGLALRVTWAAVPIEPMICCGQELRFLGIEAGAPDLPAVKPQPSTLEKVYREGETYTCAICGIEVLILRSAKPLSPLDCCGEGMDVL